MGRNILFIGIGETGCAVVEKLSELRNAKIHAASLAIDTDKRTLAGVVSAAAVPMVEEANLNAVVEAIGAENLNAWFPCNWEEDMSGFLRGLEMSKGSNMWRLKALLSFAAFLNNESAVAALNAQIDTFVKECEDASNIEIFTVNSLSGGTGSALFIPFTYYVKNAVRKAGGDVLGAYAMLSCPDIYESFLSREQRQKGYSNAYAALRELHAVNLVSRGYGRECMAGKHAPVAFSIEIKGENVNESIYNASSDEFWRPEAAPFTKVTLFERVPGIDSIGDHVNIMIDTIKSLCVDGEEAAIKGTNNDLKTTDDIYGATALTKAVYPVDSIVQYMAKRKLLCEADGEWLRLHRRAMREIYRRRGEARAYGYHFADDITDYSEIIAEAAETLSLDYESELGIIGRQASDAATSSLPKDLLTVTCLDELDKIIDEKCLDSVLDVVEKICDGKATKVVGKSNFFGAADRKRKSLIVESAKKFETAVLDCYDDSIAVIRENMAEIEAGLLSETGEKGAYSFVDALMKKDGKFLHPAYALSRLCVAYNEISRAIEPKYVIEDELIAKSKVFGVPDNLFSVSKQANYACHYAKLGEDRFLNLVEERKHNFGGSENDEKLFIDDVRFIADKAFLAIRSNFYERMRRSLAKLIEGYRKFFEVAERALDELESDVKAAALIDSKDTGLVVNVASGIEDKEHAYAKYMEDVANDGIAYAACDEKIGASVAREILAHPGEMTRTQARKVMSDIGEGFKDDVKASDFYALHLDKNILAVLLEPDAMAIADVSPYGKAGRLSRTFNSRSAPLRLTMPENSAEFRKVTTKTRVLLPEAVRVYSETLTSSKDPEKLIAPLLSSVGEGSGSVSFSDGISDKYLYIRREVTNVQLHFIEAMNENENAGMAYKNYVKSFELMNSQTTQMWNPHIFRCEGDGYCRLPYISPEKQVESDKKIAKALLHAFVNQEIFIGHEGKLDVDTFCYMENGIQIHIFEGNDPVPVNEPEQLFAWLAGHPAVCEKWAKVYDRIAEDGRKSLKDTGSGAVAMGMLSSQISETQMISMLRERLLSEVYFYKKERNAPSFAEKLLAAGYDTLLTFCRSRFKGDDFDFVDLYDRQLDAFITAFAESGTISDVDDFKDFIAWVNGCGAFLMFKPHAKTCALEVGEELTSKLNKH